jgi:hypothetical protein
VTATYVEEFTVHTLLKQESPELARKLERLSLEKQQDVLRESCLFASKCLKNPEPPIQELFEKLAASRTPSPTDADKAASFAEAADAEYLDLLAQNTEQEKILNSFAKARLFTALSIVFGSPSGTSALDGIYEVLKSCSDASKLIQSIEGSISSM